MTGSRIACGLWDGCQQDDGLHDPWCPASGQLVPPVDPADWTPEQAQAAQAELDELERTDPDVAAAAASYDRMVEKMTGRTIPSALDFQGGTVGESIAWTERVQGGYHLRAHLADAIDDALIAQSREIHAQYQALAAELRSEADATLQFLREKGNGSINHEQRRMKAWTQRSAAAQILEVGIS